MSESSISKPTNSALTSQSGVRKKYILVTGSTGLVGSNLIKELVRNGSNVKALIRSDIPDIVGKENVKWIKGDILDIISLEEAMQDVEQVYHCAAIVSFNPIQKHQMFLTNIEGTANVVNTALQSGVTKLCFVSSVAALGRPAKGKEVDETMSWNEETSTSNYGKSKYLAEMEVWRGIGEGLRAVIVNPSIILGAGNWNEGSTKIFKTAFEEFPWYTEGETGFVDVNDLISIMIQLMAENISGERFIVSAENRKYKSIFTAIANAFGKKAPYKKATPLISGIVWRLQAIKSVLTNMDSLLTRETAHSAQAVTKYNNTKLVNYLPLFNYTPIDETIERVCAELQQHQKIEKFSSGKIKTYNSR